MTTGSEYKKAFDRLGSVMAVAREFGVHHSTVSTALRRLEARAAADPAVVDGMDAAGMSTVPHSGWIKTSTPDDDGRTYSWYVKTDQPGADLTAKAEEMAALMADIPAVNLDRPMRSPLSHERLGLIPLNDLHAGAHAWAKETGYDDWDLKLAVERLKSWVGSLVARMPVCDEVILFYNGDTLHTNGEVPLTPASGHMLDKDGRNHKIVNMVATAIVATIDMAAQKHVTVRVVIKRGNHDEDSYLALLMAVKWRYRDVEHVTVDEDPSPYWVYVWGSVMLFGHHGDRQKPEALIMKMAADHADEWGRTKHRAVWTGDKHHRASKQFMGAMWEQASCLTAPDAYGASWGSHAQAQAVIYHKDHGEIERFTVRPSWGTEDEG
jgi:hypothetical protein